MKKKDLFDNTENIEQGKNMHKLYISFHARVIITSVLAFIFLFCSIFLILNSLSVVKLESINYEETGGTDYRVYLKENDGIFEKEYYDKSSNIKTFAANYIDNIKVSFNYLFTVDKPSNVDITYDVTAELITNLAKDNSPLDRKEYTLVQPKTNTILDSNSYSINQDVVIDYEQYNNLANKFKYGTGIEIESYLNVYLNVRTSFSPNTTSVISLKIPLSEKTIQIKLDEKGLHKKGNESVKQETKVGNRYKLFIGFISAFISLVFIIKLLKLLSYLVKKKSKYDKYINKILREYDRLIINTRTPPKLEGFNIIQLDSFQELLDARDNVKGAIKYYVVTEHQKCNFYFVHDNDLYLLVIKEVDIENLK